MFAIIEIGGKQYKVSENDVIRTEVVEPSSVKVLLVSEGENAKIGTPFLASAKVPLTVLKTGKSDKVITIKMKAKKRYKRQKNHRQNYADMKVGAITA